MANSKKFSFVELTNNNNGKTSASIVAGLFIILIGGLSFIYSVYHKTYVIESTGLITIGSTLLGIRRFTKDKPLNDSENLNQ